MAKIKIEIKHYITGAILFEYESENNTILTTLKEALKSGADLTGANLYGADLTRVNLYGADLTGANLYGADLTRANLTGADLTRVNLYGANLTGANLYGANLTGANLYGADLTGANLTGANLTRANLTRANLTGADLTRVNLYGADLTRADLYGADLDKLPESYINLASRDMLFIFEHLKAELPGLRKALVEGRVNGTQYEGKCACLIGTLGNVDGGIDQVCSMIPYYDKGLHNPGEQWFWRIKIGDTPKTNAFAKHAVKLIDLVLKPKKTKK